MHEWDDQTARGFERCVDLVRRRVSAKPPLGAVATPQQLAAAFGAPITRDGLGVEAALGIVEQALVPATIALDHPRFFAFVPVAPSLTATAFDLVVSASSFSGESWLEAAGAVHAENQVLALLAHSAGLPAQAGGCFVSGGTAGNLSALAVARDHAGGDRRLVAVGDQVHSSVRNTLRLLGLEAVVVPSDGHGRVTGSATAETVAAHGATRFAALVGSGGTTNSGSIDDLAGMAEVAEQHGLWFHVDAAYGGAALLSPAARDRLHGVERADSLIIDPHKWLYGPLDCCALLYRDPALAAAVHRQDASYLDPLHVDGAWNPADYALHLTRRARGLPLWFSLVVHGVAAYEVAIDATLRLTQAVAQRIRAAPHLELILDPQLSVVLFRRLGWDTADYLRWTRDLLGRGTAFIVPTRWEGEVVARLVFLHPSTTLADVDEVLASTAAP